MPAARRASQAPSRSRAGPPSRRSTAETPTSPPAPSPSPSRSTGREGGTNPMFRTGGASRRARSIIAAVALRGRETSPEYSAGGGGGPSGAPAADDARAVAGSRRPPLSARRLQNQSV